jgi:hypothetical protein
MPLTDNGRNQLLTGGLGVAVTHISLHSGDPGTSGANELTGGSPAYARKAVTWTAAAAGVRDNNAALTFDVPAATTVFFIGLWSALTAGTFYGWFPVGGVAPMAGTVTATTNKIESKAHGLANADRVVVYDIQGGGVPTGLVEGTVYFVVATATDNFEVSLTQGGAAVDITADGELVFQKLVPETFSNQGTYEIATGALDLDARFV